nr:PREDICTED: uncharacterized protein LOC103552596 [Equus przewalskii]
MEGCVPKFFPALNLRVPRPPQHRSSDIPDVASPCLRCMPTSLIPRDFFPPWSLQNSSYPPGRCVISALPLNGRPRPPVSCPVTRHRFSCGSQDLGATSHGSFSPWGLCPAGVEVECSSREEQGGKGRLRRARAAAIVLVCHGLKAWWA